MKRTILGILFLFSLHGVSGQNISRRAISAGGGYFSNSNFNVSSTLGETFTATLGGSLLLSQGFQQKASVDSGVYLYWIRVHVFITWRPFDVEYCRYHNGRIA
jgi:hypothetical protein